MTTTTFFLGLAIYFLIGMCVSFALIFSGFEDEVEAATFYGVLWALWPPVVVIFLVTAGPAILAKRLRGKRG